MSRFYGDYEVKVLNDIVEVCDLSDVCAACQSPLQPVWYLDCDDYGVDYESCIKNKPSLKEGKCHELKRCTRCGLLYAK